MVAYIGVAYACNFLFREPDHRKTNVPIVFDGVTFCTSVMLLWGLVEPTILVLLGNTKPYLLIAGIAGVSYSISALFQNPQKRRR
jgi:hypothetical protein